MSKKKNLCHLTHFVQLIITNMSQWGKITLWDAAADGKVNLEIELDQTRSNLSLLLAMN